MNALSRKKKIMFTVFLIFLTLLLVEAGAFAIYYVVERSIFPRSEYQSAIWHITSNSNITQLKDDQIRNTELRFGKLIEVIHPYLGFVLDPRRTQNVSEIGFRDDVNSIISRTDNKLIIGIFGGSFAAGTYSVGRESLINALRATGKDIVVLNFTLPGYKQPQQLLALTYLLSLGAQFDIVINIDGFNEVALPPLENVPKNVFPLYPRAWFFRVAGVTDQQALMQLAQLAALDQKRKSWAQLFAETKLYHSIASCLIWKAVDRLLESRRTRIILKLQRMKLLREHKGTDAYAVTGPQYFFPNDDALYKYLATSWKRCSIQMQAICEGNGIRYYHFLQPNQYVEGSKPMKKEEREVAIKDEHPYRLSVVKGYPISRGYGEELIRLGVKFHDLTMIFAGNGDLLYKDDCCHLNAEGYKIIATTIGGLIKEDLLNQQ